MILFLPRMVRAAYLDKGLYEEVVADRGATAQVLLLILLVGVATGIGSIDQDLLEGLKAVPPEVVVSFIGWVVWASLTYMIGAKLLPASETRVDWSGVGRAGGFALSPGTFRPLAILPGLGILIPLAAITWQFVAMVVAAQQALSYGSSWRALGVVATGFIPYLLITGALRLLVVP